MTLAPDEFMRRFLLHVLPGGFHRIRHYGLLANGNRRHDLARVRQLIAPLAGIASSTCDDAVANTGQPPAPPTFVCRHCGRPMLIVQLLAPDAVIRAPPSRTTA